MVKEVKASKALIVFLGIEAALYGMFLIGDLQSQPTSVIKYLSICACFILSLIQLKQRRWVIPAAMAFTLLADAFLLLLDRYYLIGVLAFCIVQTLYAIKLCSSSNFRWFIPRLVLFGLVLIVLRLIHLFDPLTAAAAYSFTQLTLNVLHSWCITGQGKEEKLLAIGLTLFWGCDTCVGLHNILTYLPSFPAPQLIEMATFCMWLFYLPAQVLIVLSGFKDSREAKCRIAAKKREVLP